MELAVCVCNYNKKNYVLDCIGSALNSTYQDFDFYFIDNGSTDGSVDAVKAVYGQRIQYILNDANLGSSGGFNTALKMSVSKAYDFTILLDHDVVLDKEAIGTLMQYAKQHSDVGIVGGKMLYFDKPDIVQIYGSGIHWDTFSLKNQYKNWKNNQDIPPVVSCDFVPAGILLVKNHVIEKVGFMDEAFFTYWDDADWCFRVKKAGYQVVAISDAFVLHHYGVAENSSVFPTYMFWRNRIRFFLKHLQKFEIPAFCNAYLKELFQATYSCTYQHKKNSIHALMCAMDDGINGLYGVPKAGKIGNRDVVQDKALEVFSGKTKISVIFSGDYHSLRRILDKINRVSENAEVIIICSPDDEEGLRSQQPYPTSTIPVDVDVQVEICKHIFEVDQYQSNRVYMDEYLNVVADDADRAFCQNYGFILNYFMEIWTGVFLEKSIDCTKVRG